MGKKLQQVEVRPGVMWLQFTTEELEELTRICNAAPADDLEALRFTRLFTLATYASEAAAQVNLDGEAALARRMEVIWS